MMAFPRSSGGGGFYDAAGGPHKTGQVIKALNAFDGEVFGTDGFNNKWINRVERELE